jgi:hypothetical protein
MAELRIASHPDDPDAPLADRLLLALGIWPHHAVEAGDDEVVEAAVIIRSNAHRYPMVTEDWGTVRADLEHALALVDDIRAARAAHGPGTPIEDQAITALLAMRDARSM